MATTTTTSAANLPSYRRQLALERLLRTIARLPDAEARALIRALPPADRRAVLRAAGAA